MYKLFLFTCVLFLCTSSLTAQSDSMQQPENKFLIGVQGGSTILGVPVGIEWKYLSAMRPSFDYMYGASFQMNLRKRISLRAELNYEKTSAHGTYTIQHSPTFFEKKTGHFHTNTSRFR